VIKIKGGFEMRAKRIVIDNVWSKNKDSLMNGERLSDIARNPNIIEGTDSLDTINHWLGKYRENDIVREDYLARDRTGQLYDGYHRLVAAKSAGRKYVFVKEFSTEEEFLNEQCAEMVNKK